MAPLLGCGASLNTPSSLGLCGKLRSEAYMSHAAGPSMVLARLNLKGADPFSSGP